jgi:hypothetical protein
MTARDKDTLKGYFNTGDVPTESNFADLIDSIFTSDSGPKGNTILVYHANGNSLTQYDPNDAGLDLALSEMLSGDRLTTPACGVFLQDHVLAPNCRYNFSGSYYSGSLQGASGSILLNAIISRLANDAEVLRGVFPPVSGIFKMIHCEVTTDQQGSGHSYAVSLTGSGAGTILTKDCDLLGIARGGGNGYAAFLNSYHKLYQRGGSALGTTDPYNV